MLSWGYEAHFCSAEKNLGVEELEESMKGKISVFAGPSGVGKSSLINALRMSTSQKENLMLMDNSETLIVSEKNNDNLIELAGRRYISDEHEKTMECKEGESVGPLLKVYILNFTFHLLILFFLVLSLDITKLSKSCSSVR